MAVEARDIMFFFAANRPNDDTSTTGGAVSKSAKVTFKDIGGTNSAMIAYTEDNAAAQQSKSFMVIGRDSTGALVSEAITTHATTPSTGGTVGSTTFERIIRIHQGTVAHTVATQSFGVAACVVANNAGDQVTGTAQASTTTSLTLAAGASATDDFYKGWVLRVTGATAGSLQIREVIKYNGTTKVADVRTWTAPTGTVTYALYEGGAVFEHSSQTGAAATSILDVCRPFYNVAADPSTTKTYYEKIFAYNCNSTTTLSNATIQEDSSGDATLRSKIAFDLAATLGDSATSTNRVTDPGGFTYDDGPNDVANSKNFSPNTGQGIWMRLSLSAGDAAQNAEYALKVNGQTT